MKHVIDTLYWTGDIVYRRVAADEDPMMITCVQVAAHGGIMYGVTGEGGASDFCFECELTNEFIPEFARGGEREGE